MVARSKGVKLQQLKPKCHSFLITMLSAQRNQYVCLPILASQTSCQITHLFFNSFPCTGLNCSTFRVYACACSKSLQSCLTLYDPVNCSPPNFFVHGILQARILEWVALPSPPGDLPDPRIEPPSLISPELAGRFFTISETGKPLTFRIGLLYFPNSQIYFHRRNRATLVRRIIRNYLYLSSRFPRVGQRSSTDSLAVDTPDVQNRMAIQEVCLSVYSMHKELSSPIFSFYIFIAFILPV